MEKHWSNYCTLSIVHFMAFPDTIRGEGAIVETVTKIAEDPFFGGIEIGWIKDPLVRKAVKKVIQTSHINVAHGAQSALLLQKLSLNNLDSAERKKAVDQICSSLDEAAEVGARRLAFLAGPDPGDADRPTARAALMESVLELAGYGRERGIGLTLETFDRNVDKKSLIGPSDYAEKFSKDVRKEYPDFGLMYDLSHMPLLAESAEAALTTLKDELVHIHIGNCVVDPALPGYGDMHPPFGWPGGVNDIPQVAEFIRALFKVGYLAEDKSPKPWIGFEVKPQSPDESSALVIANAKRVWQEAWAIA